MKLKDRIQHAWNAFNSENRISSGSYEYGPSSASPSHRAIRRYRSSDFASAIFNRIAIDASMTDIVHVKIDSTNEDRKPVDSGLHYCLNTEANIDQTNRQFLHDLVYSMFDEGVVAVVPVETTLNPNVTGSYEIDTLRVGKIVEWYPKHIKVKLYNDKIGDFQDVVVSKHSTAIIENPLYAVVNGPNATLTRLLRKMALLDSSDEEVANGKLEMFITLPYAVKTDLQVQQAEERLRKIEEQLSKNKRGITYIDSTEKIQQLTRPINASLNGDVAELNTQFYNQLGLTENVINGTASEAEMRTYYTRTIDPIIENIIAEFNRKFLTKTARTQGQVLEAHRDPFKLVALEQLISMGDTFRRNEIATTNEVRRIIGMKSSNDPKADDLSNPNIAAKNQGTAESGSLTSPDESSSP